MRVVHAIKATRIAGAENHLLTLLPGLRQRGIDAQLLLLTQADAPADDFAAALAAAAVPVERIPIAHHADVRTATRLRDSLRLSAPAILHTHLIHADLYGAIGARLARVPHLITSRHNDDPFRRRWAFRLLSRALWRQTRAGIAISESIRRFCIAVEGARPDAVTTIHYGLPAAPAPDVPAARAAVRALIGAPAEAPVIGFVGRLIAQKGVSDAVAAFALLAERHPAARLLIIGDGPLRASLEAQAAAVGLGARVHFAGWRADAAALMPGFDMFVMPSLWEGFGLVLLEAMAAAVPVVAAQVSAIPEIVVDGETGLLVPPNAPADLATALEVLLNDQPLRRHFGLVGQERGETHFGAARMIDAAAALYRRVAGPA